MALWPRATDSPWALPGPPGALARARAHACSWQLCLPMHGGAWAGSDRQPQGAARATSRPRACSWNFCLPIHLTSSSRISSCTMHSRRYTCRRQHRHPVGGCGRPSPMHRPVSVPGARPQHGTHGGRVDHLAMVSLQQCAATESQRHQHRCSRMSCVHTAGAPCARQELDRCVAFDPRADDMEPHTLDHLPLTSACSGGAP